GVAVVGGARVAGIGGRGVGAVGAVGVRGRGVGVAVVGDRGIGGAARVVAHALAAQAVTRGVVEPNARGTLGVRIGAVALGLHARAHRQPAAEIALSVVLAGE